MSRGRPAIVKSMSRIHQKGYASRGLFRNELFIGRFLVISRWPDWVGCRMARVQEKTYSAGMKTKRQPKDRARRPLKQPTLEVQVIPAPTILWHPSISLEKLVSDFAQYQDSIIVS